MSVPVLNYGGPDVGACPELQGLDAEAVIDYRALLG